MTYFVWDEVNDNVLFETEAGAVDSLYTNELQQFGSLVSQHSNSESTYYHFDGHGSTRELTDEHETVTGVAIYSAFGDYIASSGKTTSPFAYIGAFGYYAHSGISAIYVRARWYSTSLGRWIAQDSMGVAGEGNLYQYVGGDPIDRVDPSGLFWAWVWRCLGFAHGIAEKKACKNFIDKRDEFLAECEEEHRRTRSQLNFFLKYRRICPQRITPTINRGDPRHAFLCCVIEKAKADPDVDLSEFENGYIRCLLAAINLVSFLGGIKGVRPVKR